MRLVIVDPNLVDTHGHHALYATAIVTEARRRGLESLIIGHEAFPSADLAGAAVFKLLKTTCYDLFSADPLFAGFEDVEEGNRRAFGELAEVSDLLQPTDLVLLHTVSHRTLLGTVSWMASFAPDARPACAIFLMLPTGFADTADGGVELTDAAAALGYRAAFRTVEQAGVDIAFFGSGMQHAQQFSRLAGQPIPSHALLTCFDEIARKPVQDGHVLLYAGDAKLSKGLALIPEVVRTLVPRHPDLRFFVQANPGPAWGRALEIVEELRALAPQYANLEVRLSELSSEQYADLLATAAVTLLPYDPVEYRSKSSGVMWETIASAGLAVVPEGTWHAAEAKAWSVPIETFAPYEADAAAQAVERAIASVAQHREALEAAAERFAAGSGIKVLLDQIGEASVQHFVSHLLTKPMSITLSAEEFEGTGWHNAERFSGRSVRWSEKTAQITFAVPAPGRWTLLLEGLGLIAPEQVEKASLSLDGAVLEAQATLGEGKSWTMTAAFDETESVPQPHVLTLTLPWHYQPENEPRALGVLVASLRADYVPGAAKRTDVVTPTPVSPSAAASADGWTQLTRHAGWQIEVDPREDYVLAFAVHGSTPPQVAHSGRVFVGGRALAPQIRYKETYAAEVTLPAALFLDVGPRPSVEVVFDAPVALRMGVATATRARVAPAASGATPELPAAGSGHTITFDESFEHPAFYFMERRGAERTPFRWMGRESEAHLPLPDSLAGAQTLLVEAHLVHYVNRKVLDGFRIGLDGSYADRYDVRKVGDAKVVKSALLQTPGSTDAPLQLSLRANDTVDLSEHGDARTLSVALQMIVVRTVDRE